MTYPIVSVGESLIAAAERCPQRGKLVRHILRWKGQLRPVNAPYGPRQNLGGLDTSHAPKPGRPTLLTEQGETDHG